MRFIPESDRFAQRRLRFPRSRTAMDSITSRVGWWWGRAMPMLGADYGWDSDSAPKPIRDLSDRLLAATLSAAAAEGLEG